MVASFKVDINVDVLKYAIQNSGYADKLYDVISGRFKSKSFTKEYFQDIINGEIQPSYVDLKKIDEFLNRGIPFYFLDEPPKENFLTNFRSRNRENKLSPKTERTLREYHYLREDIDFLMTSLNIKFEKLTKKFDISDDVTSASIYVRKLFNYSLKSIEKKSSKEVFDLLRKNIEDLGIFVFKKDLDYHISGSILLSGDYPPLILINSNEDKNREIFTLLHEFAHYLINTEEIDDETKNNPFQNVEKWCNEFAYNFLVGKDVEHLENFTKSKKNILISNDKLEELSNKYKISKLALMYRFFILDIISEDEFREYLNTNPYKTKNRSEKNGGSYHNTQRDRLSKSFIDLVNKNYSTGNISTSETFNYLGIKDISRLPFYVGVLNK